MSAKIQASPLPLSEALVLGPLTPRGTTEHRYDGAAYALMKAAQAAGRDPKFVAFVPDIFPVLREPANVSRVEGCGCFEDAVALFRMLLHLSSAHKWDTYRLAAFVCNWEGGISDKPWITGFADGAGPGE